MKTTTVVPYFKWRTNGTPKAMPKTFSPRLYHIVGTLSSPSSSMTDKLTTSTVKTDQPVTDETTINQNETVVNKTDTSITIKSTADITKTTISQNGTVVNETDTAKTTESTADITETTISQIETAVNETDAVTTTENSGNDITEEQNNNY